MSATVKLKLKPLMVPNFAIVQIKPQANTAGADSGPAIPLADLDDEALEDLAYSFLVGFYKKAGKTCPFYRPTRARAVA